jgi:hypothetical protein
MAIALVASAMTTLSPVRLVKAAASSASKLAFQLSDNGKTVKVPIGGRFGIRLVHKFDFTVMAEFRTKIRAAHRRPSEANIRPSRTLELDIEGTR